MRNIICKLFGHRVVGLQTKRFFARCDRCNLGLKVSYDMAYGDTLVTGDYGNQTTFIWCDCGNELISTNSHIGSGDPITQIDFEFYKCSKCGHESRWDFGAPVPYRLKELSITQPSQL